jgi:heat shock protein HtpX
MKRIVLFVLTNLAVLLVLAGVAQLLGLGRILDARGIGLDLPALLGFALVFGMGGSMISLLLSKWTAKRLTGARVIEHPTTAVEIWLLETVRQQAQAQGIGMPEVAIFDAEEPNAFATGARRNRALVAVSQGLLRRLSRAEVEAVLGHEVSHVANGDMVTLALIQGVVNAFVLALSRVAGWAVDRIVFRTEEGHGPAFFVASLVAQLVFGLLASPIVFWFSRQREYRADAGAARLVGARPMIAALERLRTASPDSLPSEMRAFGITGNRVSRWFSTHPSLDSRIAALQRLGGV